MTEQEARFHRAVMDGFETAKRECKYNATYFLGMVADYGVPRCQAPAGQGQRF